MKFHDHEIRRIVNNEHNYELSHRYVQNQVITEIHIEALSNHIGYFITAMSDIGYYENECSIQVNEQMQVQRFTCDCPYCNNDGGCVHIGALMLKINELNPSQFPFHYDRYKEDDKWNFHIPWEVAKDREERMQRIEAYRQQLRAEQKAQEEKRKRQMTQLKMTKTATWINKEKDRLYRMIRLDQSGNVQLRLLFENTVRYHYDYGLYIQMKIGRNRFYIVKNIVQLIDDVQEQHMVHYGKELEFVHHMGAFDEESRMILDFLHALRETKSDVYNRKLYVCGEGLRLLYELCQRLPASYCDIETRESDICVQLQIHDQDDHIQLELCNMPALSIGYLDESGLYQVEGKGIICYHLDAQGKLARLLQRMMMEKGELLIAKTDIHEFAKYIWQDIRPFCRVSGDETIFALAELDQLALYGDMDDHGMISLRLEGRDQDRRVQGFDDTLVEKPLSLEIAETYIKGFAQVIDTGRHIAYLPSDDDSAYVFLRDGIPFLQEYCEIYVSDAMLKLGKQQPTHMSVGLRISENLLEVTFDSQEITREELFEVLRSYRQKRSYHRLRNHQLLTLKTKEMEELDTLMNILHVDEKQGDAMQVPLYRAISLEALPLSDQTLSIQRSAALSHLQEAIKAHKSDDFPLPDGYEGVLRDYQIIGYRWLKQMNQYHFGAILADDMGLGKTLQVIALLESEKGHGVSLIVAPSSLVYNWQDEIHKFSADLRSLCIVGNAKQREAAIHNQDQYDVWITSYDYLRRDLALYEEITFHYVVLDEAQYIKNQKTRNARSVKTLHATHRLALSGTPIENSLAELWSLFDFLMPGYLYSYHYFVQEYEKPIIKNHDVQVQEKLKRMVTPFMLRRTKKEVLKELPDKIEQTLTLDFNEEEQKLYLANLMQVSKDIQKQVQSGNMDRIQVLAMLTKLRQICCEPRLLYDNVYTTSTKLNACVSLCLSLRDQHQRILLFSSFTRVLALLEEELRHYHFRILKLTGENTKEERRYMVKQFQDGQADIFLISLKAGGTGLNLTAAEAVIHYDPWWNISAQNQATDRAYRIGQTKNVMVFQLIMKNSIEEKIQNLQKKKQDLAQTFAGESDGHIAAMSTQEILALFQAE